MTVTRVGNTRSNRGTTKGSASPGNLGGQLAPDKTNISQKHDRSGGQRTLSGEGISPGLAMGPAFTCRDLLERKVEHYTIERSEVPNELARLDQGVDKALGALEDTANRVGRDVDEKHGSIFRAQADMLRSTSIRDDLRNELEDELLNAEQAVSRVLHRVEHRFREAGDSSLEEGADDIADLTYRLLTTLAGTHARALETVPEGSVVVARRLLPSEAAVLARREIAAVVLEVAGKNSHAALLMRELGIPAVAQISGAANRIGSGELVLVDGFAGEITVAPDENVRHSFKERQQQSRVALTEQWQSSGRLAVTVDGTEVPVMANVGSAAGVAAAAKYGADGIGLFRTEFLYLSRGSAPTDSELYEILVEALEPIGNKPVTMRLLDTGGDKLFPFLKLPKELNPALGKRGVRVLLDCSELLETQLRAFLRLSRDHNVRVLVPMVTLPRDLELVREVLYKAAADLGIDRLPALGAMIETPAAALCADVLSQYADFFSLGTNDLTQYTMAAGRENPSVSDYYEEENLAVYRLIDWVARNGPRAPLELCGELAARPAALQRLLEIGVQTVSVVPSLIPLVKDQICHLKLGGATLTAGLPLAIRD